MGDVGSQRPELTEFPAQGDDLGCLSAVACDESFRSMRVQPRLLPNVRGENIELGVGSRPDDRNFRRARRPSPGGRRAHRGGDRLLGHNAVRRELATTDADETVRLRSYPVLTRRLDSRTWCPTRVGRERSETRESRDYVASSQADVKGAIYVRQDLVDLDRSRSRSVGRAVVLVIGRPDYPSIRPWDKKADTVRYSQGHPVLARNSIPRYNDVSASAGLGYPVGPRRKRAVRTTSPDSRRVNDGGGPDVELRACELVAGGAANDATVLLDAVHCSNPGNSDGPLPSRTDRLTQPSRGT